MHIPILTVFSVVEKDAYVLHLYLPIGFFSFSTSFINGDMNPARLMVPFRLERLISHVTDW